MDPGHGATFHLDLGRCDVLDLIMVDLLVDLEVHAGDRLSGVPGLLATKGDIEDKEE